MTDAEISAAEKERQLLADKQAREKAESEARAELDRAELIKKQADARVREIYAITDRFDCPSLRDKAMSENWSVERVRQEIMDNMKPGTVARFQQTDETGSEGKSVGTLFIESAAYREIGKKIGRHIEGKFSVEIPKDSFLPGRYSRATFASGGDSGQLTSFLTQTQALPGVPGLLDQQQLRISQLFPQSSTTSRRIAYIIEDTFSNTAAARKEDATKPNVDLDISETYTDVQSVACYTKVTEEMLADTEGIRSYIDDRLGYMVMAKEDNYLVNGTGTAPEIRGLANVSGIQTIAASSYTTVADAFGQAINKVRSVGFVEPDAIMVHPDDWTNLILSKDANGQYYAGGPFLGAYGVGNYSNVGRMFGLPVVNSTFVTKGTAYVGAFRIGSHIFRRQGLTVESTNSEASDFIFNRVTIRAESRMGMAIFKPKAFCQITAIA